MRPLTGLPRSPGIRTYQATLLGLLTLASGLGARRGTGDDIGAERLAALAGYVREKARAVKAGTAVFPGILTFCLDPAWIRITTARDRAVVAEGVKRVVAAMRGM